jgi:SAM-dependent methyltransferase
VPASQIIDQDDRESRDRAHFDRIAATYTRKDEAPSSRVARRFRLDSTIGNGPLGTVLEVGCGAGYAVDYLGDRVSDYLGVDHSDELVGIASACHGRDSVEFRSGRIQDLRLETQYETVLVIGVLHHLDDVESALATMVGSLRPGGWLRVNEPQPDNPVVRVLRRLRKRLDSTYAEDQIEFAPEELRKMFTRHGLVDVSTTPQGFLSTPFAEVPLPAPALSKPLARAAVAVDRRLAARKFLRPLAWNCVAVGRKP